MNEQIEKGISLIDLWKVIWNRKIILGIISVIILILGIIAIKFGYNPNKVIVSTTFEYTFPGVENGKYPNGQKFDYRDIVGLKTLEAATNSKDMFANINIEEMYDEADITINKVYTTKNGTEVEVLNTYRIEALAKYFNNEKVAKDFLLTLINMPYDKAISSIDKLTFDGYLISSSKSAQYDSEIDFLIKQRDLLKNGYAKLIETYDDQYIGTKKISEYQIDVARYFTDNNIDLLVVGLNNSDYVKNIESYLSQLNLELKNLEKDQTDNNALKDALEAEVKTLVGYYGNSAGSISTYEEFNKQIAECIKKAIQIAREIRTIEDKIRSQGVTSSDKTAFENQIKSFYDELVKLTNDYEKVTKEIYLNNSNIYYSKSSVVEYNGGISMPIAAVASLIVGFGIACVAILIVDLPKLTAKKEEEKIA